MDAGTAIAPDHAGAPTAAAEPTALLAVLNGFDVGIWGAIGAHAMIQIASGRHAPVRTMTIALATVVGLTMAMEIIHAVAAVALWRNLGWAMRFQRILAMVAMATAIPAAVLTVGILSAWLDRGSRGGPDWSWAAAFVPLIMGSAAVVFGLAVLRRGGTARRSLTVSWAIFSIAFCAIALLFT